MDALIRASIGGALGVALVWALCRLLPWLSPAMRATIWWCAAAKFLVALVWIAPVAVPVLPAAETDLPSRVSPAPRNVAGPLLMTSGPEASEPPAVTGSAVPASVLAALWPTGVLVVWSVGVLCAVVVGLGRWRLSLAIVGRSTRAPDVVQVMAAGLSARLGLRRSPIVCVSDETRTPLVTGLLRPVVVLPASTLPDLSGDQARMAICHELAHVRRGDLWLGCVPAIVECLFFFHPLARLATREYALSREVACDAAVIDALNIEPRRYGQWLLDLGVARRDTGMAAAGASWSGSQLKRRLLMLGMPLGGSPRTRMAAAIAIGAVAVTLIPFRLVARSQPVDAALEAVSEEGGQASPRIAGASLNEVRGPAAEDDRSGVPVVEATVAPQSPTDDDRVPSFFITDGRRSMANGRSSDWARARAFQRDGERLLWFRLDGTEYVARGVAALDAVEAAWQDVNRIGTAMGKVGDEQGKIGAEQGQIGEQHREIGRRQGAIGALYGELGARRAELGLQLGALSLRQARLGRDEAARQRLEIDRRSIEAELAEFEREMERLGAELTQDMKSWQQEAHDDTAVLRGHAETLGEQMRTLHNEMQEATAGASRETRRLFERFVAEGTATPVD